MNNHDKEIINKEMSNISLGMYVTSQMRDLLIVFLERVRAADKALADASVKGMTDPDTELDCLNLMNFAEELGFDVLGGTARIRYLPSMGGWECQIVSDIGRVLLEYRATNYEKAVTGMMDKMKEAYTPATRDVSGDVVKHLSWPGGDVLCKSPQPSLTTPSYDECNCPKCREWYRMYVKDSIMEFAHSEGRVMTKSEMEAMASVKMPEDVKLFLSLGGKHISQEVDRKVRENPYGFMFAESFKPKTIEDYPRFVAHDMINDKPIDLYSIRISPDGDIMAFLDIDGELYGAHQVTMNLEPRMKLEVVNLKDQVELPVHFASAPSDFSGNPVTNNAANVTCPRCIQWMIEEEFVTINQVRGFLQLPPLSKDILEKMNLESKNVKVGTPKVTMVMVNFK